MKKDDKIQIVGGGTFGLSTAYYLAKAGYSNIIVIDREEVPSKFSAGYDLNKIIRPEYEDQFYTNLALEAIEVWESEPFTSFFHKVGYVNCNSANAPAKTLDITKTFYNILKDNDKIDNSLVHLLTTEDEFKEIIPLEIDFEGWTGYFNKYAGYAQAFKALDFLGKECKKLGVKFIVDRVQSLVIENEQLKGVKSCNSEYLADLTIVSLGAHITHVMPELGEYVTPQAWSVGHLHLSPEEARPLQNMPVLNCRDIGFCFEPDSDKNILKMCNSSAGWVNYNKSYVSIPTEDNDGVCDIDKEALDHQAKVFFPNISKPVVDRKICWCCDRGNSDFMIDYHPKYKNLLLATADSGHGFKMLPIFGKWVLARINGTLTKEQSARWKWFEKDDEVEDISWRLGKVLDLANEKRLI